MKTNYLIATLFLLHTLQNYSQNVGIGTNSPNNKLEIKSATANTSGLRLTNLTSVSPTVSANGKSLSVDANGDVILTPSAADAWSILGNTGTTAGTNFLGTTDSQDLVFKTNNTEWMRMLVNGNVGIGTNLPIAKLHIEQAQPGLWQSKTMDGLQSFFKTSDYATTIFGEARFSLSRSQGNAYPTTLGTLLGGLDFRASADATHATNHSMATINAVIEGAVTAANTGQAALIFSTRNGATFLERMRINNAGNVGIGTTSPSAKLHLRDNVPTGSLDLLIENTAAGGQPWVLESIGAFPGFFSGSFAIGNLATATNPFVITPANNIGIGSTNPNNKLEVNSGVANASGLRFTNLTSASPTITANGKSLSVDANGDVILTPSAADAWSILGNAGTTAGTNFLGTADAQDLVFKTNNSEKVRVLTNGNVGIGTATPVNILSIVNSTPVIQLFDAETNPMDGTSEGKLAFGTPNGEFTSIEAMRNAGNFDDVTDIVFKNSWAPGAGGPGTNLERMRINYLGNVGIGTAAPSSQLHVSSTTTMGRITVEGTNTGYTNANILLKANNGPNARGLGIYMNDAVAANTWYTGRPYANGLGTSDMFVISRLNAATVDPAAGILTGGGAATGTSMFFTVNNIGYVGIGTSNPQNKLDIDNGITYGYTRIGTANADFSYDGGLDETYWFNHTGPVTGRTSFVTGINELFTVVNSGNVGIGNASPASKLHVAGEAFTTNGYGDILYVGGDGAGNDNEIGLYAPLSRNIISFYNRTLGSFANILARDITSTTGNFISSDRRYKKNILDIESPLANLKKLHGVTYYMKTEEFKEKGFSTKKQIGVIAQELEEVYPELIHTDAEGFKSVDYAKLTPILIEAMKEMDAKYQKQIEELTKKVEQLSDKK